MKLVIEIDEDIRIAISRMGLLRVPDEMQKKVDKAIQHGTPIEQELFEDRKQKLEKEYLFESLCEDLKKLQAENESLRNALEQEPILDKIKAEIETIEISGMVDANTMYVRSAGQIKNIVIEIIDKYREQKPKTDTWSIKEVVDALERHGLLEQEPKTDILEQIRAEIESRLQGVNTTLDVLVKDDALIPRMEAAKTTLEEVLEIIDKAIKEVGNETN